VLSKVDKSLHTKLFVVTPTPMMKWMEHFKKESLKHAPDMVEFVPSNTLNPENFYYY